MDIAVAQNANETAWQLTDSARAFSSEVDTGSREENALGRAMGEVTPSE